MSDQAAHGFQYDFLVLGSGPAGIHAAVQASKLGRRVAVVEAHPTKLGGSWLHTGTVPSKTLREALDAVHNIQFHAGREWVSRVVCDLSTEKLYGRARRVSADEEAVIRKHLKNNGIDLHVGHGCLEDRNSVRVLNSTGASELVTSQFILIATGSRPRRPLDVPFDGWRIVDSDEVLHLEHLPRQLVIYGAGVIGCEYACIFSTLGIETKLVDSRSRIMQFMDQEVATELQKTMEGLGVEFLLGKPLKKVYAQGPKAHATFEGLELESDLFFFAAGRVSNSDRLGLGRMGIPTNDRSAILTNEFFQTSIPNVYAAGDVIGPPALAATSSEQGRIAAAHAFGQCLAFPKVFPIGVYTIPELSCVGLTEEECQQQSLDYVVGRASYAEMARGYIRGDNHGLLKLIVDRATQRILGIHIVGDGAANLVHIGMAFMLKGGHAQDLVNMIFNYPTLAEAYRIAAFNALNKIFTDGVFQPPVTETLSSDAA